jgi:hypothetical protein
MKKLKADKNSENASYHSTPNLCSKALKAYRLKYIELRINLPVVLYGCATLSLALRDGHRLRVSLLFRIKDIAKAANVEFT